LFLIFTTLYFK